MNKPKQAILSPKIKKWRQNAVYRILTNPVYIGHLNRGGESVAEAHKPIIKEAQFEKMQKDLKTRKAKTRGLMSPNILTGLIFCKCSSVMPCM